MGARVSDPPGGPEYREKPDLGPPGPGGVKKTVFSLSIRRVGQKNPILVKFDPPRGGYEWGDPYPFLEIHDAFCMKKAKFSIRVGARFGPNPSVKRPIWGTFWAPQESGE